MHVHTYGRRCLLFFFRCVIRRCFLVSAVPLFLHRVFKQQALLQADLGATTSFQIIEDLRNTAKAEDRRLEPDDIKSVLRATLIQVCSCSFCGGGVWLLLLGTH